MHSQDLGPAMALHYAEQQGKDAKAEVKKLREELAVANDRIDRLWEHVRNLAIAVVNLEKKVR